MPVRKLTIEDLLGRVDLYIPLEESIITILDDYNIGKLISFEPLLVGHEEMNIIITTNISKYGIKFINKRKSKNIAKGIVTATRKFDEAGVPITKIIPNKMGEYLHEITSPTGKGFLFIAEYFEGKTFNEIEATREDIAELAKYIAKSHLINYKPYPEYDFWIPLYFIEQFEKKGKYLNEDDFTLLQKVYEIMKNIDFSKCTETVGHFDAHRDNIKKSFDGNYCFFDLATVDIGPSVIDLGAFIGFFLYPKHSLKEQKERCNITVKHYEKIRKLNNYEKSIIFDCIKLIYAANVLGANYLIKAEKDNTDETMKWYDLGKWGLNTFLDISNEEWESI